MIDKASVIKENKVLKEKVGGLIQHIDGVLKRHDWILDPECPMDYVPWEVDITSWYMQDIFEDYRRHGWDIEFNYTTKTVIFK